MMLSDHLDVLKPQLKVQRALGKKLPHLLISCFDFGDYFYKACLPSYPEYYEYVKDVTVEHPFIAQGYNPLLLFNPTSSFGRAILSKRPQDRFVIILQALCSHTLYREPVVTNKRWLPLLPKKKKFKRSILVKFRLKPIKLQCPFKVIEKIRSFLSYTRTSSPSLYFCFFLCQRIQDKIRSGLSPREGVG